MTSAQSGARILLLGATGAVGQRVLRLALADARVAQVVAPTRRPLTPQPKLDNPVTNFSRLPDDVDWWHVDAVICALGTTIKTAGSQQAFAAVDRDLPLSIAARARAAGARSFALNSALGASPSGNFYLRTKAEAEDGVRRLLFPRLSIVRPSLIDVQRDESRPGERVGLALARLLGPLIPRRFRPVKAEAIAQRLLDEALNPTSGTIVVESHDI